VRLLNEDISLPFMNDEISRARRKPCQREKARISASVESVFDLRYGFLRSRVFAERICRLLLAVIYVEDRDQFCDLEQVADMPREIGELDRAPIIARRGIECDQRSQPAAIDIVNPGEIENQVSFLRDKLLHRVAQMGRFFTKDNAAGTIEDENPIDGSSTEPELQKGPPFAH
jgi:hypothetical protein